MTAGRTLALALVAAGVASGHPSAIRAAAKDVAADALGPADRLPPPGAVTARSFDELAAMVADPHGPAVIALLPQVYRGDLIVKRPVAISGTRGTILAGSGKGTVVSLEASGITVEDVTVRDSGRRHTAEDAGIKARGERIRIAGVRVTETLFGISLQECRWCTVERSEVLGWGDDAELRGDAIKLWESHDSAVRHCRVEHSRDVVVWYTRRATLENNVVVGSRYGSHFMYAHDSVVRNSRFESDVVGVFVMYSMRLRVEQNVLAGARGAAGVGLGFKESDGVEARGNWMVANTTGIYLDDTPRSPVDVVRFEDNVVALNDVALRLHTSERGLVLRGNDFHQNAAVIEVDGGGNSLAAEIRGNRFSDYEGYDLDHDGRGDVAYEVKALSSELTESRPALKLLSGTAALGLVDAVARAVPILSSRTLLVDPAPLVSRPSSTPPRTP